MLANLATALLAAALGRWFLAGMDGWVVAWIVFAGAGMAAAVQAMAFLESEGADG